MARNEQLLIQAILRPEIIDDPEAFVRMVFPWGEKGTPLEFYDGPRTWQLEVLRGIKKHLAENRVVEIPKTLHDATASGRGIGKSALVSWLVLWFMSTRIGGTCSVSANTEDQLKKVTWGELGKWLTLSINSHWFDISATQLRPARWFEDVVKTQLRRGTEYYYAAHKLWSEENPDAYAGVHNPLGIMLLFDEASGIPKPIWSVAEGFFTEPVVDRFWFAFSNPRNNQGAFFECFNSNRDFWNTRNIDSRTVEGTDKALYERIIKQYGEDSDEARVEVKGQFPRAGDSQFISSEVVADAIDRARYDDPYAPVVIGVDVARFGSDKTCIAVRQGRDLLVLKKYSGLDTMQVVGRVIEAISKWNPDLVVIDEGGLGAGVVDRLLEQRYKVRGVNFGSKADANTYANKRTEMWARMRDWLVSASIGMLIGDVVKENRDLHSDLTGVQYKLNSSGSTMLESKADMKKRGVQSPDGADALAVTFAYNVSRSDSRTGRDKKPRMAKDIDYSIFG